MRAFVRQWWRRRGGSREFFLGWQRKRMRAGARLGLEVDSEAGKKQALLNISKKIGVSRKNCPAGRTILPSTAGMLQIKFGRHRCSDVGGYFKMLGSWKFLEHTSRVIACPRTFGFASAGRKQIHIPSV